jgi:hypothetical protein
MRFVAVTLIFTTSLFTPAIAQKSPHRYVNGEQSFRESPGKPEFVNPETWTNKKSESDPPNPVCGLMGMEARAGLPPRPILAQCGLDSVCTPVNPECTSNCKGNCIPKPLCNSSKPCPKGFMCEPSDASSTPLRDGGSSGQCERVPQAPLPANAPVAAGRRCGMNLPDCPQPQQYCASNEPNCFSLDVCPGTCKVWPARPPPKYPSCGGFTRTPNVCPSPNVCVDDPYNGPSCGMSCDVSGICVRYVLFTPLSLFVFRFTHRCLKPK